MQEKMFGALFQYDGYSCHCECDIENVIPGDAPRSTLKMYADCSVPLSFAYSVREGLMLSGVAGGIKSSNILGQLLALPGDDIEKHIDFFSKYGFFFPLKHDEYEAIDAIAAIEIANHIKATVRLMSAIAGKKNYKSILINTVYLLYSPTIEASFNGKKYSTCRHAFTNTLDSHIPFPDYSRDPRAIATGFFEVSDTLTGKERISLETYNAVRSGRGSELPGSVDPRYMSLVAAYCGNKGSSIQLGKIIDFFYHYQSDTGVIRNIEYGKVSYYSKQKEFELSDAMKALLLDIAMSVVAEEINHNIAGIHPRYTAGSLTPTWQVDNLLQALYFSVFYMKPGVEIYKECKNPRCKRDKFFLVEATRANKEYCCVQCSRAAAAQRFRSRKLDK